MLTEYQRLKKNNRQKERRHFFKHKVFELLGGPICNKCGYTQDIRALQIDHILGDGYLDNKQSRNASYYQRILNNSEAKMRYQILCANCNQIKKFENNEHNKVTRLSNQRSK